MSSDSNVECLRANLNIKGTSNSRSLLHDNIVPKPDLALELGKSISLTEAEEEAVAREVHATHARIVSGPDPEPMQEDQTGSNSGKLHVSLAGPNPEHMDDEFLATAYPKVHENLKLITDERVIEENPESHSGSMSSMKNLDDTYNFGDQFLYDKPTEDDQEKSKVIEESDSTIPDPSHQTVTSTPPVIAPFTDVSSTKPSSLVTPPPINTEATTITTSLPEITPFIALQLRVARLEQEMSEVKKTDHSADVLASIKSQVPTVVDEYLGTKLDDALLKILERHTADLIEKYSVLPGPESCPYPSFALEQLQMRKGKPSLNLQKASTGISKFPSIYISCSRNTLNQDQRRGLRDHSAYNIALNQTTLELGKSNSLTEAEEELLQENGKQMGQWTLDRDDNAGDVKEKLSVSCSITDTSSSISHLLNQYLLPVKNHSLQLSPPTSALQQSSSVLEMVKSRLLYKSVQDLRLL
ncbi:hypothetical protein Tco_0594726 [Tanacetum coccineum]